MSSKSRKFSRELASILAGVGALPLAASLYFAPDARAAVPIMRDGSRDLDFDIGVWRAEITRFREPFADSNRPVHLQGTITVRPIWNGKAELEEIEVATANGQWEAASLYLYDPVGHQWSRNYVSSDVGRLDGSPKIGKFSNGELALYSQETFEGRSIIVREIVRNIERNSHDYAEDYSADGGREWRPAFRAHMTRIAK
jgi:hypothetical protein